MPKIKVALVKEKIPPTGQYLHQQRDIASFTQVLQSLRVPVVSWVHLDDDEALVTKDCLFQPLSWRGWDYNRPGNCQWIMAAYTLRGCRFFSLYGMHRSVFSKHMGWATIPAPATSQLTMPM